MALLNIITNDNLEKVESFKDYCHNTMDDPTIGEENAWYLQGGFHAFEDVLELIETVDVPELDKKKSHKGANIMIGGGVIILGVVFWPEIKKVSKKLNAKLKLAARNDG